MTEPTLFIRRARIDDVPFLAKTDLAVDLEDTDDPNEPLYCDGWGEVEHAEHRAKIAAFVADRDKSAWIVEDSIASRLVGMVLALCQPGLCAPGGTSYKYLHHLVDECVLPPDVPFGEVFQLWVDPAYRRRGIASELKRCIEADARTYGARFMYTHTRVSNQHVVILNLKLGYIEVRRGPLWDAVERVSLIKWL